MTSIENNNDPRFVQYYAEASATERARFRAQGIQDAVLRARRMDGLPADDLVVADIGCNAGTQSRVWLEAGHRVVGVDISQDLIALASERNREFGGRGRFQVGSATSLPWPASTFDVCLMPELLEHVDDWMLCVREAVRILRPGGTLYVSTTNVLCPIQQEFNLPLYSWYPESVKRKIVARARTTAPHLVSYATYPAIHWFNPYRLGRVLRGLSIVTYDRFDMIDLSKQGTVGQFAVRAARAIPMLRLLAHILTPSTTFIGHKLSRDTIRRQIA